MLFFVRKWQSSTGSFLALSSGPGSEISESVSAKMDEFMGFHTASIELLWNGRMEKVFFPLPPICQQLDSNDAWKDELMNNLQNIPSNYRSNPLQKAIKLMHLMDVDVADLAIADFLSQNFKW